MEKKEKLTKPNFHDLMLELNETVTDLKILRYQLLDASKTNSRFDGMPELLDSWIERKEKLIKGNLSKLTLSKKLKNKRK